MSDLNKLKELARNNFEERCAAHEGVSVSMIRNWRNEKGAQHTYSQEKIDDMWLGFCLGVDAPEKQQEITRRLAEESNRLFDERKSLSERLEAAEAELARREEAAGEPVALRWRFIPPLPDIPVMAWTYIDNPKYFPDVRGMECAEVEEIFTAAQQSALPTEITSHEEVTDVDWMTPLVAAQTYCNKAIAESKALGCKAIKLPEPYDDGHGNEWLPRGATVQTLKSQGFTLEGENND